MRKWVLLLSGLFLLFAVELLATVGAQSPQVLDILNHSKNSNVSSDIEVQSAVDNVTVTKFEVISPTQLSINLKYYGAAKAPGVTVDVGAINVRSNLFENFLNVVGNSSNL